MATSQAKTVQLDLAKDVDFKELVESRQLSTNTFKPEKDLQPGHYFWRLASIDGDNQGPYMPAASFTYKALLPAPDISQLIVKVINNRVFISTIKAPEGLRYEAVLHNKRNQQYNVWHATDLGATSNFLLKEYGKQTLILRYVEADGTKGADAQFEFNASPP